MIQITMEAARVNAGLTQIDAAKALGVSQNTVSNWETGKAVPSLRTARRIAECYGMPLDAILFPDCTNDNK